MRVQKIIRMQAAMIGLGAALLLASAALAQEITNTEFPDRPGTTEPTVAPANVNSTAVSSAPATGQPVVAQAAAVKAQSEAKGNLALPLIMFGIGGVALAVAETKRKATDSAQLMPSPKASL
jgi:hypothetical protein